MTKTIMILAIAAILVAGTLVSITDVFAAKEDKPPKEPKTLESECAKKKPNSFDGLLCEAVFGLQQAFDAAVGGFQGQIDDLVDDLTDHVNADNDLDSSNEDQTLSGTGEVVLGRTAAGDGGGTVICAAITGDTSLCDGDDAVVDADSSTTNEIQTLSISGRDLTISGGNTVTLPSDSAPQAFHLKGTSTSSGNVAVNGLSKTFTLSEAAIVFVSSGVETRYSIPLSQLVRAEIEIDSSVVSIGPVLDDDGLALMVFPSHVSWTGQLSAGTHTISTHVLTTVGGTVCPTFGHGCNMNILVLGQ